MLMGTVEGLSKSEAGRILGLSAQRVSQLKQAGVLPYRSTALGRLVDPVAVAALKVEREKKESAMSSAKS